MNKACNQPKIGIRAGGKYATGALPEPSFSGFLKDRAQAAVEALTPATKQKLPAARPTLASAALQPVVNAVTDTGATGSAANALQARKNALDEAMNYKDGTPFVEGPGTGTSDSVNVDVSRGEAILPAKTVQAVGVRKLAKLIKETNGKEPTIGVRGKGKYANGVVDDFLVNYKSPIANPRLWGSKQYEAGSENFDKGNIAVGIGNKIGGTVQRVAGAGVDLAEAALDPPAALLKGAYGVGRGIFGAEADAAEQPVQPAAETAAQVPAPIAAQPAVVQPVNAPAVNPTIAKPTPAAKVQYSNQAMPGSATSTDTAMGVDARNGIDMKYGDNTTVVGTHTPMSAPTQGVRGIRMQNRDTLSGQGGSPETAALDAPVKGMGARDFSANNMDVINAGIRKRVAAGGANTFEGRSAPMSPEQQAAESARVAEGQRVAGTNTAAVAAINESEQADANKAPDLTAFPDTIAGNRARNIAIKNYAMKSAGTTSQAELGIRRKQADTQNMSAQTQAANAASEAGLRNIQGQDAALKMADTNRVRAMRDQYLALNDKNDPGGKQRAEITRQMQVLSGSQGQEKYTPLMGKDEMGNPVFMGAFDTRTGQRVNNNVPAQTPSISREQVDAAAKAKGITDPSKLKELYATYGV